MFSDLVEDCRRVLHDAGDISFDDVRGMTSVDIHSIISKHISTFRIGFDMKGYATYQALTSLATNAGGIAMMDYDPDISRLVFAHIREDSDGSVLLRLANGSPGQLSRCADGFYYQYNGLSEMKQADVLVDVVQQNSTSDVVRRMTLPIRSTMKHSRKGADERIHNAKGQLHKIRKTVPSQRKGQLDQDVFFKNMVKQFYIVSSHARKLPFDLIGDHWGPITDGDDCHAIIEFVESAKIAVNNSRKALKFLDYIHTPEADLSDVRHLLTKPFHPYIKFDRATKKGYSVLTLYYRDDHDEFQTHEVNKNELQAAFDRIGLKNPIRCPEYLVRYRK